MIIQLCDLARCSYSAGEKLSIYHYEEGVGVKVLEETARRLLENDPNVIPFQPLGRPKMREWIQINLARSEDYRDYLKLFEESIEYIVPAKMIFLDFLFTNKKFMRNNAKMLVCVI